MTNTGNSCAATLAERLAVYATGMIDAERERRRVAAKAGR